jgi:hypothetical protein
VPTPKSRSVRPHPATSNKATIGKRSPAISSPIRAKLRQDYNSPPMTRCASH